MTDPRSPYVHRYAISNSASTQPSRRVSIITKNVRNNAIFGPKNGVLTPSFSKATNYISVTYDKNQEDHFLGHTYVSY
jgi:S-adenosylmethionine hydrolase